MTGHPTHRLSRTRFYNIRCGIIYRCDNKASCSYYLYGARGIVVSKSRHKFENFKRDMYNSYLEHIKLHGEVNTTIDRIDNSKGYSKKNCSWATPKQQARNKRNSRLYTYRGKTLSLQQWAEKIGVTYGCLYQRIFTCKRSIGKAINFKS